MIEVGMVVVRTPACMGCHLTHELTVRKDGLDLWRGGMFIQHAFPELNADDRELLLTGTCKDCWDAITVPEDDEDDDENECAF